MILARRSSPWGRKGTVRSGGPAPTPDRRNQARIGLDQGGTAEPGHLTAYFDFQADWTAFGLRHRRLHGATVRPWAETPAPPAAHLAHHIEETAGSLAKALSSD